MRCASAGPTSGNSCSGAYAFTFTQSYLLANSLMPGTLVHTQYWMRDPASPSTTGLSNAVRFQVCQ